MTTALTDYAQELEGARANLEIALHTAVPATWDDAEDYVEARQPREIAEALIDVVHVDLERARIAYLFRKEMTKGGDRVQLAHASKVPAKWRHLAKLDFLIEVNWTHWRLLQPRERIALVDHELCHCGRDLEAEKWVLVHHDVEEFGTIVRRWGAWKPDLAQFARQLELFTVRAGAVA